MTQYYRIADLVVAIDSFGRFIDQAKPYLIDNTAGIVPDIEIKSDYKWLKEKAPHLSDEDCEYLSSGGTFYRKLLKYDGMMLHSSAVMMDGRAYLFSAPCGTGKSTHTKLWQQVFGEDKAVMLNDDKPAIRLVDGVWYAYGTPWSGKYDISTNTRVPLAGICMLRRGEENKIEPYGGAAAVKEILEQTARVNHPEYMMNMLGLIDKLFEKVPVWKLECNMEPEAALLSHKVMSEAQK